MSMTFQGIAGMQSQLSASIGQAQANSLGLGKSSAQALGVTNLMQANNQNQHQIGGKLQIGKMFGNLDSLGVGKTGLGASSSRLRGQGLTNDLMDIGQSLLVSKRV